jgi:hypothetical protein
MENLEKNYFFEIKYQYFRKFKKYNRTQVGYDTFFLKSKKLNFKKLIDEFKKNLKGFQDFGEVLIFDIEKSGTKNWNETAAQRKFIEKWKNKLESKKIKLKFNGEASKNGIEILKEYFENDFANDFKEKIAGTLE